MTRNEYFIRYRETLLHLDDNSLGLVMQYLESPPPSGYSSLYERLFPTFSEEHGNQKVGARVSAESIVELAKWRRDRHGVTATEADLLVLGQRARDLLQGNPTALWNVAEERRRRLEPLWIQADKNASAQEQLAAQYRTRAQNVRTELDAVLADLAKLQDRNP